MATVKRSIKLDKKHRRRKREREDSGDDDRIVLPEDYTEPSGDINDFSILVHGVKKIGKTTLANEGGRTLFLQFDPSQRTYRRMEIVIRSYKQFRRVMKKLQKRSEKGDFPWTRICIDRADMWYRYCEFYVMEKLCIEKMSEEPYGGAWDLADRYFTGDVDAILDLPCGKWFLCHSTTEVEEDRRGKEITVLRPKLSKRADAILNGKCDAWFAYIYNGDKRELVLQGNSRIGAGHRIDGHFLDSDGERLRSIPMPKSARRSWRNFESAFNNEYGGDSSPRNTKGGGGIKLKVS